MTPNCTNCGVRFDLYREHPAGQHFDTRRCPSCGHKHDDLPDPREQRRNGDVPDRADTQAVEPVTDGGDGKSGLGELLGSGGSVTIEGDVNIELGEREAREILTDSDGD